MAAPERFAVTALRNLAAIGAISNYPQANALKIYGFTPSQRSPCGLAAG